MEVKIEVDELQFKNMLDKQLEDMPVDVLQNIIAESVHTYFTQDKCKKVENLFVDVNDSSWTTTKSASQFLLNVMEDCDFSAMQDIIDKMLDDLNRNYHNILIEVVTRMIVQGLSNHYSFYDSVNSIVRDQLVALHNPEVR